MSVSTKPYTINVLAAGRRTRDNIMSETGVGMKIVAKRGGSSGTTCFTINLTGTQDQIVNAREMFGEAISRMEQWASRRRNERALNRRRATFHPEPKKKEQPTIPKAVNGFGALEVEEIVDPVVEPSSAPKKKLSKKERRAQNRKFVPLDMTIGTKTSTLPSAPAKSWAEMADEDSDNGSDSEDDEDDGFTVVKHH